jgi:hypothetical protein
MTWTLLMATATFAFAVWIDDFGGQLRPALSAVGWLLVAPGLLWLLRMRSGWSAPAEPL